MLFSEGLAIGMEDVGVGDEVDDEDEENGDMAEKDDTDLCFQKHTGKYYCLQACLVFSEIILPISWVKWIDI